MYYNYNYNTALDSPALVGSHLKRVVSRSEFCADLESRILSLSKLKLLQKTNQHLGWVIKRKMNCAK